MKKSRLHAVGFWTACFILVAGLAFAAGTVTKGLTGKEDIHYWNGTTADQTFTRATSSGYNMTLHALDAYVDVAAVYGGGTNKTRATLQAAMTAIGTTNKATLLITPGTWTLSSSLNMTTYPNLSIRICAGALIQPANGVTLTIGKLEGAPDVKWIDTSLGGTVSFAAGAIDKVSPRWWGGVGDGVTDDTTECNAAAASLLGGGRVDLSGGRWLIDTSDLLVPQGVTLIGPYENLGEPTTIDYTTWKTAIILNPTYTVRLNGHGAGVRGFGIFKKGLTVPTTIGEATTLVAGFSGTAITVGYTTPTGSTQYNKARDTYVGHMLILGFQWAYWCDYNERPTVERVKGDCTNGLYLTRIYDMKDISKCHFWPFLTTHQSWTFAGAAGYSRTGSAYKFDTDSHWGSVTDLFSFGYAKGFELNDVLYVNLVNCSNDHQADMALAHGLTTYGVHITGESGNIELIGHRVAAQTDGVRVENDITRSIRTTAYKWTKNGATNEYYCQLIAGGDPLIALPTDVVAGSAQLTPGTAAGSLNAGEWIYALDPTSTFWTVYVRLADSTDPDTKALDHITIAPAAGRVVTAVGCKFWGQTDNHVHVVSGIFNTIGSQFMDTYGVGVGILGNATAYEVVVGDANQFDGMNTPFSLASVPRVKIAPTNTFHRAYQPANTWYRDTLDFSASSTGRVNIYNNTTTSVLHYTDKGGGSAASPQIPIADTSIKTEIGRIWDSSAWGQAAGYRMQGVGTASAGSTPGKFVISTTPASAVTLVDRVVVDEDGNLTPAADNSYSCGKTGLRWTEVWAVNGTIQTSDERMKKSIAESSLGLDFVAKLRPIEYEWKDEAPGKKTSATGKMHHGFSAQEVKTALAGKDFAGVVYDEETDSYGINYAEFIPLLTTAIQEQQKQIEGLKEELAKVGKVEKGKE